MRKLVGIVLLLGVIVLAVQPGEAQLRFGVGLRTGLNFASMSFDPELFTNPAITKGGRTGFLVGAAAELEFARMFAAEMDILYVMKGAKFTQTANPQQGLQEASQTIKLSELEIPILFKTKFLPGTIRPYAFVGPVLAFVLSASAVTEVAGQQTQDIDLKNNPGGTQVSSMDFTLQFGGGAEYMIARNFGILMDVRYALGLSNIHSNEGVQQQPGVQAVEPSWKTRGFLIQVGGMFHL